MGELWNYELSCLHGSAGGAVLFVRSTLGTYLPVSANIEEDVRDDQ